MGATKGNIDFPGKAYKTTENTIGKGPTVRSLPRCLRCSLVQPTANKQPQNDLRRTQRMNGGHSRDVLLSLPLSPSPLSLPPPSHFCFRLPKPPSKQMAIILGRGEVVPTFLPRFQGSEARTSIQSHHDSSDMKPARMTGNPGRTSASVLPPRGAKHA